jgi:hypothetical protein
MRLGWAVLIVLACPLAACGKSPRVEMASCRMETLRVYPASGDDDRTREAAFNFDHECMTAKGYVWNDANASCPSDKNPAFLYANYGREECYRKAMPWE